MNIAAKVEPQIFSCTLTNTTSRLKLIDADNPPPFWSFTSVRMWLAISLCSMVTSISASRTSLGGALMCMLNDTGTGTTNMDGNHVDTRWTSDQIALLFSVVSWASLLTGVPGGFITDRYGSRLLCIASVTIVSISTLLFPTFTHASFGAALMSRVLLGVGAGLMMPCIISMTSKWYPRQERTTCAALWSSGNQIGIILAYPLASTFCAMNGQLWEMVFYATSAIGVISTVMIVLCTANSPERHWAIRKVERDYIQEATENEHFASRKLAQSSVPWRKLLTSPPVIVTFLSEYAATLLCMTLSFYLPSYYSTVLKMDVESNGLLSMLPFASMWAGKIVGTVGSNWLLRSKLVSSDAVCKMCETSAMFLCAFLLLLGISLPSTHHLLTFTCITLAMGSLGFIIPGHITSMTCIAPAYSGLLSSVTLIGNAMGGAIGPFIVGQIVVKGTQLEYQYAFGIIALQMIVSGVLFAMFGSTQVQDWAKPPQRKPNLLRQIARGYANKNYNVV